MFFIFSREWYQSDGPFFTACPYYFVIFLFSSFFEPSNLKTNTYLHMYYKMHDPVQLYKEQTWRTTVSVAISSFGHRFGAEQNGGSEITTTRRRCAHKESGLPRERIRIHTQ